MKSILILSVCVLLAACQTYINNGVAFDTPEEALADQRAMLDRMNRLAVPLEDRIGGSALVIQPDRATLGAAVTASGTTDAQGHAYLLEAAVINAKNFSEFLRVTGMFDSIEVIEAGTAPPAAFDQDYVLYPPLPDLVPMMMARKGGGTALAIPDVNDTAVDQRPRALARAIVATARRLSR